MKKIKITSFSIILSLISLNIFCQTTASPSETNLYGRNKDVGKYLTIRGFNMYYETYGKGEPLLLIHGNSGSINNFLYQIPFFAESYQVIVVDSRAQGNSKDVGDSLSFEMMADDFNALLETINIDSCHVIGWSDGGINALLLAVRHPDKVKKLAITGVNLWSDSTSLDPFISGWSTALCDSLKSIRQTPQVTNDIKLLSLEPHLTLNELEKIKCPVLVIAGDHDIVLPKHSLAIAENIPNANLWIIPNAGHSTPIFQRKQFNETIADFFKKEYRKIEGFKRFE